MKLAYKPVRDVSLWQSWLKRVSEFCKTPKATANLSPLLVSKPLDNRPYISVEVFSDSYVALLDSGASDSVLGERGLVMVKKYSLKIYNSVEKSIRTADGVDQKISGYVMLPVSVGNIVRLLKVLVVPSLCHSLIFGSDFCRLFRLTVDFSSNSYLVGGEDICVLDNGAVQPIDMSGSIKSRVELSETQSNQLKEVVEKFEKLSWLNGTKLGRTDKIVHSIDTGDASPIKQRQYQMSPYMLNHLHKELDEMLKLGVVQPSSSPWSSPVLLVKKSQGNFRLCFDGRKLNSVTKKDAYPLPRVDYILNKLAGARYLSSIDLKSAFWQIPLDEKSKEKTAFSVPGKGLFEFVVMPFGLNNAPQTQQRLMDRVLGPELDPHVFVYLDDIIIATPTFQKHVEVLLEVYERLTTAKLTINADKCKFCFPSLNYLGFVVDQHGLRTNPEKISAMVDYPRPENTTQVKRFIGMCSWYRRFIPNFSTLTAPITALIKGRKKGHRICWSEEADKAFTEIKQSLVSSPILASPDFSKRFTVQCDASNVGLGCVLTQENDDGTEVPIAYASRTLSSAERNYSVTEKECLAVLFAIDKFRPYVEGVHFKVITDHHSLLWLHSLKDPVGRLARWAVKMQQFDFELEHRKGSLNVVPDALSRAPKESCLIEPNEEGIANDRWYRGMVRIVEARRDDFKDWDVIDGRLYKFVPSDFCSRNPADWKLVVPRLQRQEVIRSCHDVPTAAHLGIFKTINRVCDLYYWQRMRRDIKQYVRQCKVCAAQKMANTARPGLMGRPKRVSQPWQLIAADIIGPLPKSANGASYLLVVTDWFTKFSLLKPLRQANGASIAQFLEENVFLLFGVPQILMCDNGTEFINNRMRDLADQYGVKLWPNARYHAQVNYVERYNRTIGAAIRSYLDGVDHRQWDKEVQKIAFGLRTAVSESTGFSPSFLNFGRFVPSNGNYFGRLEDEDELDLDAVREFHVRELEEMPEVYKEVKRKLKEAYDRNVKDYNKGKRAADVYHVGDRVWKRHHVMSRGARHVAAKLAPKFSLATIKNVISPLVYELADDEGVSLGRWHVKDLKPYRDDALQSSDSDTDSDTASDQS